MIPESPRGRGRIRDPLLEPAGEEPPLVDPVEISVPEDPERDRIRIVDRHNETIGTTDDDAMGARSGPLEVDVREPVHRRLDLDEGSVTIPFSRVAGIRRNEIRLSLSIHDPAFLSDVVATTGIVDREPGGDRG